MNSACHTKRNQRMWKIWLRPTTTITNTKCIFPSCVYGYSYTLHIKSHPFYLILSSLRWGTSLQPLQAACSALEHGGHLANVEGRNEDFSPSFPTSISSTTTPSGPCDWLIFIQNRNPSASFLIFWAWRYRANSFWQMSTWVSWKWVLDFACPRLLCGGLPVLWLPEGSLLCVLLVVWLGPHSRPPWERQSTQMSLSSKTEGHMDYQNLKENKIMAKVVPS